MLTYVSWNGVTVKNVGQGPAGPFRVRIAGNDQTAYQSFTGLKPGESVSRPLDLGNDYIYTGYADDLAQVAESNETNNERKGNDGN